MKECSNKISVYFHWIFSQQYGIFDNNANDSPTETVLYGHVIYDDNLRNITAAHQLYRSQSQHMNFLHNE